MTEKVQMDVKKMNIDTNYFVCMNNDLLKGKSLLSLNEIKLLRLAILQNKSTDNEFGIYKITIDEFAKLLKIDSSNIYRTARTICMNLLRETIIIGDGNPKHKWRAFQWLSRCSYDEGIITLQLHEDLKPYLLNLKKYYTQYELVNILFFKSIYTIRLYELIKMEMKGLQPFGKNEINVYLSIDDIRMATSTDKNYKKFNDFKKNVIDIAITEINNTTKYGMRVNYIYVKSGRKIIGFNFNVHSAFFDKQLTFEQQQKLEEFEERKKNWV